ncbi:MAG TPA: alpha-(1-_3)-arabinofuranosyltransferase family protein [Acidimicrobiales bacterium]|nr:alpha-(1->3)-arabinofuranosyltransferase family protein [Acidimicrobiales bacterium]
MALARRGARLLPPTLFAALCYVPLVLTQPGWVSADTKTYLYLDPGRLLGKAWSMWDPSVGLGTVSHQSIGYLWPMGPFYWAFDALGVPDWLAQRLWWGSLLFAAGMGVGQLLRRFGWPPVAVWVAACTYALSPYVLTHIGRLSGVLLPFAGLPWLVWAAAEAIRRGGWRHPALFALIVATVGSVNLTALVLVGVAPLAWFVHAVEQHEAPGRRILAALGRIAVVTAPVNLWWLAGLSVQASNGIDVVRYSETAQVVTATSSAQEVLRGLGYWFFYGGDRIDPWVEASTAYTQRPWLLVVTFAVPVLALAGGALLRWRHRGFPVALVVAGTLLAVGAHPWGSSPPLGRAIEALLGTERGLALRSLPRAVPLLALGLALLLGGGVGAAVARWPRLARVAPLVALVPILALAPLWQGTVVNRNLRRQDVPAHWREALAAADHDDGTRLLEVPGSDFAYYRWGATVDPITPGLIDRPFVARELIPYGSAPSADLLAAFDRRLQEGTLAPGAVAPLARLLRAGDLLVRSDLQYERFDLVRPRLVWDLLGRARGLGPAQGFGPADPNEPVPQAPMHDETWLLRERRLPDPPAVALVPVEDPVPVVATKPAASTVVVDGDGDGVVDAAAAGLIDGHELLRYSAALGPDDLGTVLDDAGLVVVTDTHRQRGQRWRTVRDTQGYTEPLGLEPLREDPADNRLPLFPDAPADTWTVAEHRGGISANATSYGDASWYAPESRPAAAVDGDPTTAWRTAHSADARGERLLLTLDEPRSIDRLRLLQPVDGRSRRTLTRVQVRLDGGAPITVDLDPSSLTAPGQLVTVPATTASRVEIEVVGDSAGDRPRYSGLDAVGLAEVRIDDDPDLVLDEVVRLPGDVLAAPEAADHPLAVVLTRLRTDPTRADRDDEERSLVRALRLAGSRTLALRGTARLSARAPDAALDALLGQAGAGVTASASPRVAGGRAERPAAAVDGDPTTAWTAQRDQLEGLWLAADLAEPTTIDHLDLQVVADGAHSVPTALDVLVDGQVVAQPTLEIGGGLSEPGATTLVPLSLPATTGRRVEVRVTAARAVTTFDRAASREVAQPIAIAELGLSGLTGPPPVAGIDTGCRDDLLVLDGVPVPVRVTGSTAAALDGQGLRVEGCAPVELGAGDHLLRAAPGPTTGIDLDQLVLTDGAPTATGASTGPQPTVVRHDPDHLELTLPAGAERAGTWLVLGESHNDGWTARLDGQDLGPPTLVDGFANGWRLPPGTAAATVSLRFEPQRRVDLALGLSAVAAAVALLLALRRPRGAPPAARHEPLDVEPWRTGLLPRRPRAAVVVLGLAVAAASALVLHPAAAVAVGVAAALATWHPAARWALRVAPAALMAGAAAYVVVWQLRFHIPTGAEWPGELERAHPVALAAVVLLAAGQVVDRRWSRTGPGDS